MADIIKIIDVNRKLSEIIGSINNGKKQYLDDSPEFLNLFKLIGIYAKTDPDFKSSTKIAPSIKVQGDRKYNLLRTFLNDSDPNEVEDTLTTEDTDRIFDLFDYYIASMTSNLTKLKEGFASWKKIQGLAITFDTTFFRKLDILFYVMFRHTLPKDLLKKVKVLLKITNVEDRILDKCQNKLLENERICNYKNIDTAKDKKASPIDKFSSLFDSGETFSIDTQYGIMTLMAMFNDLRSKN